MSADRDDRTLYLAHLAHLREPERRATTRDDDDDDAPCIIAPSGVRYVCTNHDDLHRLVARINSMRRQAADQQWASQPEEYSNET